jgi:hypothetical protein
LNEIFFISNLIPYNLFVIFFLSVHYSNLKHQSLLISYRLEIPNIGQLIHPHSCYTEAGDKYRGTHSMSLSGRTCRPWADQTRIEPLHHLETIGGHNYCRNPTGSDHMGEPWCFVDDDSSASGGGGVKEACGIAQCSTFSLWLYVVLPASVALVIVAVVLAACCLRKTTKKSPLSVVSGSPRSFCNPTGNSSSHYSEMEMNSLLPGESFCIQLL